MQFDRAIIGQLRRAVGMLRQVPRDPLGSARKLMRRVRSVPASLVLDRNTRRLIHHNRVAWRGWSDRNAKAVILVDLYSVAETLISYGYFLNVLAAKHRARIESFGLTLGSRVTRKIYESFNTAGHVTTWLNAAQRERQEILFREVMPTLRTKRDVFDLMVLGVWIGIDVYETYLRAGNPTVVLDDLMLSKTVREGIGLVIFWQDYFADNQVAAVVVSHDCYLHLDVPSKVAYQAGVPVYLPNIRGISRADRPHAIYSHLPDYRQIFRRLPPEKQEEGLELARRQLGRRLSGEVGVDMSYATESAFCQLADAPEVLKKSNRIKVLICSHCFYDNPHGYGGMLFLDFYEWLHYLGGMSERTPYDWYLKVHPDVLPGTLETIEKILAKFPRITLIPHQTSHHQLAKEGIDFALTVYGSVGHELPALGIQVINAAYNPHVAYDFNWHPKSLDEYEYFLLNLDKLHKDVVLDDLYEFYFTHYYYVIADDLILKSYRQSLEDLTTAQRVGSTVYGYFLDQLTPSKHQEILANMQAFIDSGKPHYFRYGPE